ncbi:hypothetical protein HHI36_002179, partial [Cryptolaemus montrouzieri]
LSVRIAVLRCFLLIVDFRGQAYGSGRTASGEKTPRGSTDVSPVSYVVGCCGSDDIEGCVLDNSGGKEADDDDVDGCDSFLSFSLGRSVT